NPNYSGIVLSLIDQNGKEQDGFLSTAAVFNLKLQADLVVLTACQTGLALGLKRRESINDSELQKIREQGYVGLMSGFTYAGASRVMVTFWKIPAKASTQLMVRFYKGMLGPQKLSAAAALRAAQIQIWQQQKWRSPFYWAAFALNGEYR
ncbi:MAG: CHAT domain-containing protein, partial [Acidobacteriota bacterium]